MRGRSVIAGVTALIVSVAPIAAQPVVLQTKDGFAAFEGTLTEFDGVLLTIETSVGPVVIPADEVICSGASCPQELTAETTEPPVVDKPPEINDQDAFALRPGPESSSVGTADARLLAPEIALREPSLVGDVSVLEVADPQAAALLSALARDYGVQELGAPMEIDRDGSDLRLRVAEASAADWSLNIRSARGVLAKPPAVRVRAMGPVAALQISEEAAVLAHDGLVVVAAPDVPLEAISLTDLARVFSGEISDWAALGTAPGPVRAVLEVAGSDGRDKVEEIVLAPTGRAIGRDVETVPSAVAVAFRVRTTPGAIGITRYSALAADGGSRSSARLLGISGPCGIVSTPDPFSLRSGAYPLAQSFLLTRRPAAEAPALSTFLDWATGPEAAMTIASLGQLPPSLERGRGARRGEQLGRAVALAREASGSIAFRDAASDMVATLFSAERLSTTLRLSAGGGALEPGASTALATLAADLGPERYDRVTLVFAGFESTLTDGDVAASVARSAASARLAVEAFKAAHPRLFADDRVVVLAKGFGPASPTVCSDLPLERDTTTHLNRRVEVWVTAARAAQN